MQFCSAKIYNYFNAMTNNQIIFCYEDYLGVFPQKKRDPMPRLVVGEGGLEPPNGYPDRFTVCCNCHYATPPDIKEPLSC